MSLQMCCFLFNNFSFFKEYESFFFYFTFFLSIFYFAMNWNGPIQNDCYCDSDGTEWKLLCRIERNENRFIERHKNRLRKEEEAKEWKNHFSGHHLSTKSTTIVNPICNSSRFDLMKFPFLGPTQNDLNCECNKCD